MTRFFKFIFCSKIASRVLVEWRIIGNKQIVLSVSSWIFCYSSILGVILRILVVSHEIQAYLQQKTIMKTTTGKNLAQENYFAFA